MSLQSSLLMSLISPPGFTESRAVDLCQQAGCKRLHVCGRDLSEPPAYLCQRPPVAHPGLLRPHWGGVRAYSFICVTAPLQICVHSNNCALKKKRCFFFLFYYSILWSFVLMALHLYFCPSLPYPHSSTFLQMSHLPPGCARVLSGWCHGCAWDDDLWLRVHPCSLLFLPPNTSLKWGWGWCWLMDGPLLFPVMLTWADLCQDVILSPVIIYFTKDVNFEQKNVTLSEGHRTT